MAGDDRFVDTGFLRFLLPADKKTPEPGSRSRRALLVPPHCLVELAPPPIPLPMTLPWPRPDERLFIVPPTRPSWLPLLPPPPPPPPPPHLLLAPPRPAFPAGAGPRPRNAGRFGGRNASTGRKAVGNVGRAGSATRKARGGFAAAANGGEAAAKAARVTAARREKKVWVAVPRKGGNGGELEDQAAACGGYSGEDEAEERSEPGEDEEVDLLGEDLGASLVMAGDHERHGVAGGSSPAEHLMPQSNGAPWLRARMCRATVERRSDIDSFTPGLLALYDSIKPSEEQRSKQMQLIDSLAKSVSKEWPNAQLHLYGSSANSFGTSHSDVDVCLEIDIGATGSAADVLLRLAGVLRADYFDGVQAITSARVPIVRMLDPESGFSCDICINNLFAVANTKLLRDYAQVDDRLLQLASIVKHWARLRSVNETYRGTLSSYAYVLMCISFLQLREPKILPCLQAMQPTYTMVVDDTECSFFDKVDNLRDFGAENKESIAELLWAFFHYWAFYHDYRNDVISVRTGKIISKEEKRWTTRVGKDRHLICIEDPFETSHDLGRGVDRNTIRIIREEFKRAAVILQHGNNPCAALFEPYNLQP